MKKNLCLIFVLCVPFVLFAQSGPSLVRERGQVNADPLWRQALGGALTGLPAVQVQSAVVVLDGGNIKAYSTGGRPLWNYAAKGKLSPFVSRSREGTSYISRTNGVFIAVNRAGRELWRLNLNAPLSGPVVSGWDGRLFVPAGDRLLCYTASGNLLWFRNFETPITISPLLDRGGGVILARELPPPVVQNTSPSTPHPSPKAEVLRVSPFGGITVYRLMENPRLLLPVSPDSRGFQRVMVLYANGSVEIIGNFDEWYISADAGNAPRNFPRLPAPPLAAVSSGGNAAITLNNGQVVLLSADEGRIIWTTDSHIRVQTRGGRAADTEAAMLYDERGIYVLSRSGATGFAEDGRRLWFTTLENTAALPAFGDDGILYSGGRDWILYAYRLEDISLLPRQLMYGPVPAGSYGTGNPPPSPWADYVLRFDEGELKEQLKTINGAIRYGRVGGNELAWTAWIMETVGSDMGPHQAGLTHPRVSIEYRVEALRLLAYFGSRETIPWLVSVFKKETDGVVKAAAAGAIGVIGVDPDGIAIQAFFDAVSPGGLKHEQALLSVTAATGALCRFSGPPLSDTGARILSLLAAPTQPPVVQRQARLELNTLKF